jgi:hypothetical protein
MVFDQGTEGMETPDQAVERHWRPPVGDDDRVACGRKG